MGRCLGVTGPPTFPPRPLPAPGLPPVLIGIGERDNLTPNLGARHVADQLPGVRTMGHGDGHVAYPLGNRCLVERVNACLTDGTLTPHGTGDPASCSLADRGVPSRGRRTAASRRLIGRGGRASAGRAC
ncbi:alpha/beta hydrolase [Amycolatopsis arida]|uniref:alpha/beta hydrolase n=1 Tax=Amycolatopsis arida TaxID=587909 RepID=UPI0014170FE3|nr:alpha/beta hydrolase [Amycolatopsis arida]